MTSASIETTPKKEETAAMQRDQYWMLKHHEFSVQQKLIHSFKCAAKNKKVMKHCSTSNSAVNQLADVAETSRHKFEARRQLKSAIYANFM